MKKVKILIFLFAVLVSSCIAPIANPAFAPASESECLPPLFDVVYPIVTPESFEIPTRIPVKGSWVIYETLPGEAYGDLLIRQTQNEIWYPHRSLMYRYFIDGKQWKSYQMNDLVDFRRPESNNIENLFVARDGTIWGSITDSRLLKEENRPLLVRFNEATDRFEFVPDKNGLLGVQDVHGVRTNIVEDPSGKLWFFTANSDYTEDVLYSFDPSANEAQKHDVGTLSYLEIGSDGNIWFIKDYGVERYNPATGDSRFYNYPYERDGWLSYKLYFDHSGNLWVDGNGWLDLSNEDAPVWNKVLSNPIFTFESPHPESGRYHTGNPGIPFQSSNGLYWFPNTGGLLRLDLEKGEWCLMSRGESSNIVEDSEHNLWMIADSKLYKLPLNP